MRKIILYLVISLLSAGTMLPMPTQADTYNPPRVGNNGITGTATVTTTSAVLLAATPSAYRQRVIIVNLDTTNSIYVAYRTATATDMKVGPGQSLCLNTSATLYAKSSSGSVNVAYITEEIQ